MDYNSFDNQYVRDLAWALGSPPLMLPASSVCCWYEQDWYSSLLADAEPWLRSIDHNQAELATLVEAQKDKRLGRYFELLWMYWFDHSQQFEIIASNLQLQQHGRTIGELDLVVHDRVSGRNIHIELAVKFYLGLGDTRHQSSWYGTNKRDRLDIKMNSLLERQSVLTRDAAVIQVLAERGIHVDDCAVIMKGRLFYPGADDVCASAPYDSHPCHQKSIWLPQSELDRLEELDYVPQIKRGWMAGSLPEACQTIYSKHEIRRAVECQELPLPLNLTGHRKPGGNFRVFVVADDWSTTL